MWTRIVKELTVVRLVLAFVLAVLPIAGLLPLTAMAATTADVSVNATPSYVAITISPTSYNFAVVAASSTTNTTTTYFTITNTSSIQTDQTLGVTATTWSGGTVWNHAEDAVPGADLAGLNSQKGGTWGSDVVIVRNGTPLDIATNQAANTNYQFGISLKAPTSFSDGVEKTITMRVTAAAG